jgi:HPt (histidine-containing phosphotransfer) domain-containing protein
MQASQVHHDGPLDRDHLRRMALGDLALEREVLSMFAAQASRLVEAIAGAHADTNAKEASAKETSTKAGSAKKASEMAHTLKGSAHAIGAFGVADHAAALEAALQRGEEPGEALGHLREAVAAARAAIEAILKNS